jgi:hypothetical protein
VFVAHIKGQFEYRGQGGIPYFIDGGAGGELYTKGPVGTDHGYWHGYRLIRLLGDGTFSTQAVPILTPGSLKVEGPERIGVGRQAHYAGFGAQPVKHHEPKVEALELRDPAPQARSGALPAAVLWLCPPLLALLAAAGLMPRRPRAVRATAALAGAVALGGGTLAMAQQSEPDSTPVESLPNPARIWTTGDARVLEPVGSATEDPQRDPSTQTADGTFRGRCPGRVKLHLTAGWETTSYPVQVASAPGDIVTRVRRTRAIRLGRRSPVARVDLRQAAVLRVRVLRRGKRVATLRNACSPKGRRIVTWKPAKRGTYRLEVVVRSDREPVVRRSKLVVG